MNARKSLTDMTDLDPAKPRRKRLKTLGIRFVATCVLLSAVAVIAVLSLVGTRLAAPDWVRSHLTTKINADLSGLSLDVAEVSILLQDNWVPEISMQGVVIADDIGTPLIKLSDVQGTADLSELLRGRMRPGSIRVSGVQILVRRAADGQINLQLGSTGGALQRATTPAAIVEQIDTTFMRPHFASLDRFSVDNLTLRYEDARAGQAWNVDGGQIEILRDEDAIEVTADLTLLGNRAFATSMGLAYRSEIGSSAADLSITFDDMPSSDIAGQSPALSWLDTLDAPISGGLSMQVDQDGNLGPLAADLDISAGTLSPNETARPIAFEHAGADLTYDPATQVITFDALELDSKWVSTRIEGKTRLEGMADGWPDALTSQFRATSFQTNPAGIYDAPIALDAATLDMALSLDPFTVRLGEMAITDQGRLIRVTADIAAKDTGWDVAASAHVPEIAPERLLELWPTTLKPKTRNWITSNVQDVDLQNIQFVMRSEPDSKPDIFLGFDFDNLVSSYIKNVPIIENGRGTASIQDHAFVISAHAGTVTPPQGGQIDISGSSFEIEDIRERGGLGVVRLETDSTVTAALSLLNSGPFGFIDKAGQSVTLADGRSELIGNMSFAVVDNLTPADVDFTMSGELTDVRSNTLIKDRTLASSRIVVAANPDGMSLTGPGRLGQVPFEGQLIMPFAPGSNGRADVEGWIELSERFLEEFNIGLPPGSVSGAGRGTLELALERDTPPKFTLTSDLAGLALQFAPLDWGISADETGELTVSGLLGAPPSLDTLSLNAGGLRANGSVTLQPDGQLQQANFSRVQLDNWIDAPVDLVGLGPNQPPLVRVAGGTIDLRQTTLTRGDGQRRTGKGGPVSLRLDRLQVSDSINITDFTAELDMSNGPDGEFTGNVNGQAPIVGRIAPHNGRSAFVITAGDAGAVLRSANLLKQARDGQLELYLVPGDGAGIYEGKLKASNLRVKDAPTMAELLNAISLVGLLEQLDGEGIHFSTLEAKFQLAPERVTLYSGSAVGASMGISMEGYYYIGTKWLDMEGVLSPIYALNLGGLFTRQGEGLVGIKYSVDGESTRPRVQVAPLSVLTPGMFRDLFRRSPPKTPSQDAAAENSGASGETSSGADR
ncbi:MAG: DUF3971 domain-containing protein [Pseudomonadota bacterium]